MEKIDSGFYVQSDETLGKLFYSILENGFEVFIGESSNYPTYRQTEPYIPNPDKTYEENAIQMCKDLSVKPNLVNEDDTDQMYASVEDMMYVKSNVDYLLLLSE